jgi:hypothetical protein
MPDDSEIIRSNGALVAAKRKNPAGFDVRHGDSLKPWMLRYAHWLVNCPLRPSIGERRVKAASLAKADINTHVLNALHRRPDFLDYCEHLRKGGVEAAKAEFSADLPLYVETHREAMLGLKEAGELKAVAQFTIPALDRVWPKGPEVATAQQITVNISAKQLAGLESESIVVEATPLE